MLTGLDRKLVRLRELTTAQQGALLQSLALLPLFSLGLRTLGLARMQKALNARELGKPIAMPLRDIEALAGVVNLAARRGPFPASCLSRSLLLGWLLRRRHVPSILRIGVRLDGAVLQAHAWVECEGVPVNDSRDIATRFTAFDEPIAANAFRAP